MSDTMPRGWRKKFNAVTAVLKQLREDWLPLEEIYWPPYAGSRQWYPGIKEEEARRRAWKKRKGEQQRLAYLKRKQWVQTKQTAKGLLVKLSDQGRMERLCRTLHERPKLKRSKCCLVMFDFPESVRFSRDAFRHFLKESGFRLVQRSVWMSDRDVVSDLQEFVYQTKIRKWVEIFVGEMMKDIFLRS